MVGRVAVDLYLYSFIDFIKYFLMYCHFNEYNLKKIFLSQFY